MWPIRLITLYYVFTIAFKYWTRFQSASYQISSIKHIGSNSDINIYSDLWKDLERNKAVLFDMICFLVLLYIDLFDIINTCRKKMDEVIGNIIMVTDRIFNSFQYIQFYKPIVNRSDVYYTLKLWTHYTIMI